MKIVLKKYEKKVKKLLEHLMFRGVVNEKHYDVKSFIFLYCCSIILFKYEWNNIVLDLLWFKMDKIYLRKIRWKILNIRSKGNIKRWMNK